LFFLQEVVKKYQFLTSRWKQEAIDRRPHTECAVQDDTQTKQRNSDHQEHDKEITRVGYGEEQECEKERRNERHQDVGDGEMEKTMRVNPLVRDTERVFVRARHVLFVRDLMV